MAPLSLVSVNMATVAIESMLYGMFVLFSGAFAYFHCTRVNTQRGGNWGGFSRYMTPVFCGSMFVFGTVTGHWVMTIYRFFAAFVDSKNGAEPVLYYADLALTTEAIKTTFCIATLITCDILIIYRLWIVWGYNNYVIILPCCAVLGLCVAGPGVIYSLTQVQTGDSVFIESVGRWISADYSFTFATNIYCTCGIAWRVWQARKRATYHGGGNLGDVLATVVESALLYTTYVTFFFGTYQASSNVQFTAIDTVGVIAGISLMMINVRVGMGWAQQASPSTSSSKYGRGACAPLERPYALRPLTIDIAMTVDTREEMSMSTGNKSELPV
ncbi:hypothetical protein FOMPIDRAFT_1121125 [Fomitopsis schrenkii]|uniref:Uncharacterized protein n=1 Tax=Fomitopsis schrenkii TaxID=2126942 RepID=S8ED78_FOMSC|nr:hypothetical protein FOMPIDRAFT_1121125 [Fomitopsis schrenkii]